MDSDRLTVVRAAAAGVHKEDPSIVQPLKNRCVPSSSLQRLRRHTLLLLLFHKIRKYSAIRFELLVKRHSSSNTNTSKAATWPT